MVQVSPLKGQITVIHEGMYIIWNRLHLRRYLKGWEFSLCNPTSRLLVMRVAIWLNAYLIIKLFSSFLVGRFYFLIISVTTPMTWSIPSEHQQIVRILKGPISFWTQTWSCTCPPGGLSWMQTSVLIWYTQLYLYLLSRKLCLYIDHGDFKVPPLRAAPQVSLLPG